MEASRNSPEGRDPSPRGAAGRRARWQWRRPANAPRPGPGQSPGPRGTSRRSRRTLRRSPAGSGPTSRVQADRWRPPGTLRASREAGSPKRPRSFPSRGSKGSTAQQPNPPQSDRTPGARRARRTDERSQIRQATRSPLPEPAIEQNGDTGLAEHLSRHAAEEPPFEPAAFGPRHGDEIGAKDLGLDENLRSRPSEAHQAFYRDAFELRLAHAQVVVGLGQETLHLLIGRLHDAVILGHSRLGKRAYVEQPDPGPAALRQRRSEWNHQLGTA